MKEEKGRGEQGRKEEGKERGREGRREGE